MLENSRPFLPSLRSFCIVLYRLFKCVGWIRDSFKWPRAGIDVIDLFEQEINDHIGSEEKPLDFYPTALQAVCEAFKGMPHCIFDVLRARCFLTIAHDTIEENGTKYRLGIHTTRLTQNMNEISKNIKEARDYGL